MFQIRKNSLIHAKNNEIRRKSIPGDFDHKSPIMNNKQKVMEEEIHNLKEIIRDQDEEICKLKREIDKLKVKYCNIHANLMQIECFYC